MGAVYATAEIALITAVGAQARRAALGGMGGPLARIAVERDARRILAGAAFQARAVLNRSPVTIGDTVLPRLLLAAADTATSSAVSALDAATTRVPLPGRAGPPPAISPMERLHNAQKALNDLAANGVTGFVDRSGRRWDLASYVEMATRTAASNAWDQLQAERMAKAGLDLVRVSTHSTEGSCAACRPWLGRLLSLTGAADGYPRLEDAKAAGFRHPNCRCYWTAAKPGAPLFAPLPLDESAALYKSSQHQRALERKVRAAHRRLAAATTPQARAKAQRDLAAARAASAAHRQEHGLRRSTVRRRENPFRAR